MADVSQWSPIAADNNQTPPDGWPEGMPASSVNNTGRETHAAVRRQAEEGGWFDWGHAYTYVNGSEFLVAGPDYTAVYRIGRRCRMRGPAWEVFGVISAVQFETTQTRVTVVQDGADMQSDLNAVAVGPDTRATAGQSFPSGTRMYFDQADAPDGWTFQAASGEHVLIATDTLANGGTTVGPGDDTDWAITGLSVATPVTVSATVDGHAITVSEMPQHTVEVRLRQGNIGETGLRYLEDDPGIAASKLLITNDVVSDPAGVQGQSQPVGNNIAHTHGFTVSSASLDNGSVASTGAWRAPKRHVIICSKD